VVQPREVLEFYRDLTEVSGFELQTAGVLKAGKKFWALARTGKEANLKGSDLVRGYVLLATSCDGSLATTATPTTIRVVCNNTLTIAINGATSAVGVALCCRRRLRDSRLLAVALILRRQNLEAARKTAKDVLIFSFVQK
jgi:phage/plasmid-like protein (TIGR03299 family)